MMAVTAGNLDRIRRLYGERTSIIAALAVFDAGGRILGMTVGPPAGEPDSEHPELSPVQLRTGWATYPAPMIDAIKSQLTQRLQAVNQELTEMGVDMTGA